MRFVLFTSLSLVVALAISHQDAWAQSEDDLVRAGCPNQIARHARVGYGKDYVVYYVGGGARSPKGEARYVEEGTFGVDYRPIVPGFRNTVALGWWHGRRWQGGGGQYEPYVPVSPFPNYFRK